VREAALLLAEQGATHEGRIVVRVLGHYLATGAVIGYFEVLDARRQLFPRSSISTPAT